MAKITILIGPPNEFRYRVKKARAEAHLGGGCDMTLARNTCDAPTAAGAAILVSGSDGMALYVAAETAGEGRAFAGMVRGHGAEVEIVDVVSPDRAAPVSAVA